MKNYRLISRLCAVMMVIPFISGCTQDGDADNFSKKTEGREKVTNVYKSDALDISDRYLPRGNAVVYLDRIYMAMRDYPDENNADEQCSVIYSVDMNGENDEIEEYTPYNENGLLEYLVILDDGSRICVERVKSGTYYLVKNNPDGSNVFSFNPRSMFPDKTQEDRHEAMFGASFQIDNLFVDAENRIYLIGTMAAVVLSPDGEKLFHIATDSYIDESYNVGGKIVISSPDAVSYKMVYKYIDAENQKLGEQVKFPSEAKVKGDIEFVSSPMNDISGYLMYYRTYEGLFGVTETESKEIVNWMNSDISPDSLGDITILNDEKILTQPFLYHHYSSYILTKIPDDEVKAKFVIDLAYVGGGNNFGFTDYIASFNRENENFRIRIIDYTMGMNSELTPNEVLNLDIAAGKIPDMFMFGNGFSGTDYEDKGLYVDLYEFMDKDKSAPRSSFTKYATVPFETDGNLYKLGDDVWVKTYAVKNENFTSDSMTVSDMFDWWDENPDGYPLYYDILRPYFLDNYPEMLNEFINKESGTCTFTSDTFIRLLDYIKSFPGDYDESKIDIHLNGFRDGKGLLKYAGVTSLSDYIGKNIILGTSDIHYTGCPGGGGSVINSYLFYAISAKGSPEIQQGAWEFIKYAVRERVVHPQSGSRRGFPATYEAFQLLADDDMGKYYYGTKTGSTMISNDPVTPENLARNGMSTAEEIHITQEKVDEALNFLDSLKAAKPVDEKVLEIVKEELSVFLSGAKSAEDIANIIQSRVSIYLSESK